MHQVATKALALAEATAARRSELFKEQEQSIVKHTDRLFARLMICQWIAGVVAALLISPRAWTGTDYTWHLHLWAALLLGGIITSLPVSLAWTDRKSTRLNSSHG